MTTNVNLGFSLPNEPLRIRFDGQKMMDAVLISINVVTKGDKSFVTHSRFVIMVF